MNLIIKNATVTGVNGLVDVAGEGNKLVLEDCIVTADNNSGRAMNVTDGAEVTIGKGCEITGNGCVVYANAGEAGAKMPVLNVYGKISCTDENYAIGGNGAAVYGGDIGAEVNIYDGAEITSALDSAIFKPNAGVLNIYGGHIEGMDGIYQKSGVINIAGGTIVGKADNAYRKSNNGSNCIGYAVMTEFCNPNYVGGMPKLNVAGAAELISEQKAAVIGFKKADDCAEAATVEELVAQNIKAEGFTQTEAL